MRRILSLVWLFTVFASGAFAQDGLQRFERDIKPQFEFEKFTYSSASPLGANGFVLNDVVAVAPASPQTGGKTTTFKVDKVTVEDLDFERVPKAGLKGKPGNDDVPLFARLKLEGISGDDDMNTILAGYGIPTVPADMVLDYRLDPASKVLTINKLEFSLRGLARAELNLVLDGIGDKASKMEGAKDDGRLRTGTLVYDDRGLLAKVLPAMAKQNGATAEAWVTIAQAPIMAFAAGQGPETLKALDALVSYIADWKAPKSPLKITLAPPKTTSMKDFDKVMEPNALIDVFGLAVSYEGTRPGAAGGVAGGGGAKAPRAAPPQAADDTPSDGKRLTGKAAWDTVVGNTLTGRVDGKTYHDLYRKDGKLVSLLDDEVTTGKWFLEGDKVCTKYPDDDKECYSVVATGRTVTMTDAKGKGFRATLLRGNPKDL